MQDDNGEGSSTHQPEKVKAKATVERQQKKQKRKAAEGKLQVKRQEMDKAKVRLFTPASVSFSLIFRVWYGRLRML